MKRENQNKLENAQDVYKSSDEISDDTKLKIYYSEGFTERLLNAKLKIGTDDWIDYEIKQFHNENIKGREKIPSKINNLLNDFLSLNEIITKNFYSGWDDMGFCDVIIRHCENKITSSNLTLPFSDLKTNTMGEKKLLCLSEALINEIHLIAAKHTQ